MTTHHSQILPSAGADRAEDGASAIRFEDLWQGVFENPRIGIAVVGPDRRFLAANARYRELVGYSEEELRSMSFLDITHPDDRDENRHLDAELTTGRKEDFQFEKRYRRKDGRVIWVRVSASRLPGAGQRSLALIEEITERKQAEQEVLDSERRLRMVVEQMGAVFWTSDLDLRMTSAMGRGLGEIGLTPEVVVGRHVTEFFDRPDHPGIASHVSALEGESSRYEVTIGGRVLESHVEPLRDQTGSIIGVAGVSVDISERRKGEEDLRMRERQLREAQTLARLGSWEWDPLGTGEAVWSDELRRIFQVGDDFQPSTETFLLLVHPDDRFRVRDLQLRSLDEKEPYSYEYRIVLPGGETRWIRSIGFAERDAANALTRVVGVARDVTEERQSNDRLDRSLAELRALAARFESVREEEARRIAREVHDEVGQSLTALAMDIVWLRSRLARRGGKADLAAKLDSMARLVEETTGSVQRISSDLRPAVLDELGLDATAEWAVRSFEDRTGVRCGFAASLKDAKVDASRATAVFRILQEALTNIARHARATRVDVRVSGSREEIRLVVRDDGGGIDPERIGDSASLGLIGMRERALALGGVVTIEPAQGGGTMVCARIPLRPAGEFPDSR